MRKTYADAISTHRLRREIIATVLANSVVNKAGPGFVQHLVDATGTTPATIVRAALIVEEGFGLNQLWSSVDALDNMISGELQNDLYEKIRLIFVSATHVQLKTNAGAEGSIAEEASALRAAITALRAKAPSDLSLDEIEGVPPALLKSLNELINLIFAPEVMRIAKDAGVKLAIAAQSYENATSIFQIEKLLIASSRLMPADHYESLALTRSQNQIAVARRKIVTSALQQFKGDKEPVSAWYSADRVRINSLLSELNHLSDSGELNLARITVAAGLLSDIVELHRA